MQGRNVLRRTPFGRGEPGVAWPSRILVKTRAVKYGRSRDRRRTCHPDGKRGLHLVTFGDRIPDWFAMLSDRVSRVPSMRLAELHAPHATDTYAYLFTWRSPAHREAPGRGGRAGSGSLGGAFLARRPRGWRRLRARAIMQQAGHKIDDHSGATSARRTCTRGTTPPVSPACSTLAS
jgi:hypothetical protein